MEVTILGKTTTACVLRQDYAGAGRHHRGLDESLWGCMVEYITVGRNKEMTVIVRDGTEIQA